MDGNTRFGFDWGVISIERLAQIGERRVIGLYIDDGNDEHPRKQRLEIYVSATGRSVRVWRDGKELS